MIKGIIEIAVIGLGYVGLPLAVEFGKKFKTIGFDIDENRINELKDGNDITFEIEKKILKKTLKNNLFYVSNDIEDIRHANVYIVTVPTPIDSGNRPVLTPLVKVSEMIGSILKDDDVVIYESTVYPGLTEEICVPILEKISNRKLNSNFFVGYSPERINPGDKKHTVSKILKVTSGSNEQTAEFVDKLYKTIISAGTYKASSIKVAEAAKIIENSQRDINIAFVNELSKIFNLLDIDTEDVLKAASTKWNFLNFKPGLVGGHCIGVDPYYLAQKAQQLGYHPEIILSGRRINDSMGKYVASELIKLMIKKGIKVLKSSVLVLGVTFKENCPDFRNTKVINIINELKSYDCEVLVFDPLVDIVDFKKNHNINIVNILPAKLKFDSIILAVGHDQFKSLILNDLKKAKSLIYDVKSFFNKDEVDKRL